MSFVNKLWVKLFCKKVGADKFGNKYYVGKEKNYLGQNKRYVVYNGINESSKVPPMWHAWLHYTTNEMPKRGIIDEHEWQKEYEPNLSGTKHAYDPSAKAEKLKTYSSWSPEN